MPFFLEHSFRTCPWCNTQDVSMGIIKKNHYTNVASGGIREWTWLQCPRCGGMVSIETDEHDGWVMQVVPQEVGSKYQVNHLPEDVAIYYKNAQTVLNAGVPSSAAVELRRTLEAAAKHQGVTEKTLVKAVEVLAQKGLITQSFTDVLGHIRKIGNIGAHATDQVLNREEVDKALMFTTQVLRNLFEIPRELEELGAPEIATNAMDADVDNNLSSDL